jgi:hypothetical protein
VAEQVAKRLAEDPALLSALRNALAAQQTPPAAVVDSAATAPAEKPVKATKVG